MKNIKFITVTILFLISQITLAQNFELPQNIQLKNKSDYAKYKNPIVNAINWLENTPIKEQTAKRTKVKNFVMQWIMGTPMVSIGLQSFQMELTKKNPELLTSFLGGWTKFELENPSEKNNTIKANLAGFKSLMKVYANNKGNGIKKDRTIEKIIKMKPSNLEKWIRKEVE